MQLEPVRGSPTESPKLDQRRAVVGVPRAVLRLKLHRMRASWQCLVPRLTIPLMHRHTLAIYGQQRCLGVITCGVLARAAI
jgi:hypothetical protein